ncbi:MAG: PIN domain-containing protein [Candidatus Binatus sp.]|uniref:PIN domain-containing protein n=1 Tax=Candidatus Binatus sp. TaxID=2811406 RepID=UPI002716ACEF|nr:PIN domain-containing protein [Candidatus Binatus sp.]MDO8434494.1 PIN domain-containing protein [Candidatus Binatus sp.]
MRAFFDTSVLIPVFLEDHEHHERSLNAFVEADKKRDCCAAHSLAEVYATMTRLPGRHRLSGEQVLLFLENIRERLKLISLTGDEYHAAIKEAGAAGVIGGTIYDALIAQCALKAGAEAVYTWNTRHFEQFGPAIVERLRML